MILVEFLLEESSDVNAPGSYHEGRAAIQAAAESGHINTVERLLGRGIEVNAPASARQWRAALQGAAKSGLSASRNGS